MYKSEAQLKQEATHLIAEQLRAAEMRQGCTNHTYYAEILLKQLEPIIWGYAPLPLNIQQALNSGNGAYRP
jgi:hypothetical protein